MSENEEKEVIENLASELEKIDNKIKEDLHKNLKSLDSCLPNIAKKINELYIKRKERLIATKGRFNLFTTLLAIGNETRLHSRFITHLLNPEGNHDCGNLFLNLFIDTISESNLFPDKEIKNIFEDIKIQNCELVRTEKPADGRRIDIYLKFNKSIIAIENKIWAGEQPNQIFDYGKFIKSNKKKNFLFYLTLDGKESETAKIIDNDSGKNSKVEYFCLSYKEHILNWLEKCLQATYKYVNINQAIQQYQNVIKQLTNQTMEHKEMKEINDLIKSHPLIIKYQNEINQSIKEVKSEFFDRFCEKLRDNFKKSNKPLILDMKKYTVHDRFEQHIIKNEQYDNLYFLLEYDNSINSLYIGLRTEKPTPPNIIEKYKAVSLIEIYEDASANYNCKFNNAWLAGYFIIYDDNFFNYNIKFDDENQLQKEVDKTADKILDYLTFMTKKLNKVINQ